MLINELAGREFEVRRAEGDPVKVVIAVGPPIKQSTGEWTCEVEAAGLFERLPAARGVDALQAVVMALSLLRTLLEAEVERGAHLCWPGGERISLGELFGRVG